jgi:hypothetical protein
MQISLEEAVEIHARALTRRLSKEAPVNARERATELQRVGDREGHGVWMRVAESAERLLSERAHSAETTLYK